MWEAVKRNVKWYTKRHSFTVSAAVMFGVLFQDFVTGTVLRWYYAYPLPLAMGLLMLGAAYMFVFWPLLWLYGKSIEDYDKQPPDPGEKLSWDLFCLSVITCCAALMWLLYKLEETRATCKTRNGNNWTRSQYMARKFSYS